MSANLRASLFSREDVAQEVGFLIMYTANLEAFLVPMLMKLLRCDEASASAITLEVDNLSAKLAIVFKIAEQKPRSPKARLILTHKTAILDAVALRNKLAHSLYGINVRQDVSVLTNATTSRRGPVRYERLVPSKIRKVSEDLRAALVVIERQVGPPVSYGNLMLQAIASANKRAQANQKQGKRQAGQ